MVRLDMSEYMEPFNVSRLIGAPPGYVGYEEGGQLTEAVRRRPYSVVLLDEIEKAHPEVFNVLLQILEDGRLTDNKGHVVNFKNTMIIMTSNFAADYIMQRFQNINDANRERVYEAARGEIMQILKQKLRPEFLNRVDEVIMFRPLTKEQIHQIVAIQFERTVRKTLQRQGLDGQLTERAKDYLADKGYDPVFGARPLKRIMQKELVNEIATRILEGKLQKGDFLTIDAADSGLQFKS
jgi:ATP-dependent Clp protease ATP-binding subunit ClpB